MNETLNWQDLQLFLAVANAGGLAGAVKTTGLSAPTLGRRMTALERTIGCELFVRHQTGYELTAEAEQLLAHIRGMQEASAAVARWQEERTQQSLIKITAGAWTSRFIVQRLGQLPADAIVRLMPDSHFFDLRRREAHLAIRNRRPTQQGLAVQKLGQVAFAIYGAPELMPTNPTSVSMRALLDDFPWVSYEPTGSAIPSSVWLGDQLTKPPALSCSTSNLVLDAAIAGVGLCVLPCFVGDLSPGLIRLSKPISELSHIQWLVSHDEDRHLKPVHQASRVLRDLFLSNKALFAGEKAPAP